MPKIRIEYFDNEEQSICNYQYNYPPEKELLEIFPEAKEIIPQKIQDWTKVKGKLLGKEIVCIPLINKEAGKTVHDAIIERYEQLMCDVKNK